MIMTQDGHQVQKLHNSRDSLIRSLLQPHARPNYGIRYHVDFKNCCNTNRRILMTYIINC